MTLGSNRLISCVALLFTLGVALASGQSGRARPTPTPTPEDTPVRIETEEIKINVLAYGDDGKFINDVRPEDLVITENDILHQATSLRRIPASVLIVMDTGGELRWVKSLDQTRKAAAALVSGLRAEDSVAILQYSDRAEIVSEWTTDRDATIAAIGRTKFGLRSAFLQAIKLAAEMLTRDEVDNRHLVLITDGTDSLANSLERVNAFRELLSTDINVHVVSYTRLELADIEPRTKAISKTPPPRAMPPEVAAQLPNGARDAATAPKIGPTISLDRKHLETMRRRKADLEAAEEALTLLTENTNGSMIVPETKEEMIEKTAAIARVIDGSYVLTYTPKISFAEKPGERTITVTSRRPGLVVEAKRKLVVKSGR